MSHPPRFRPVPGTLDERLSSAETHLVEQGGWLDGAWSSAERIHEDQGRRILALESARSDHSERLTKVEVRLTIYAAAAAFVGSVVGGVILIVIQNVLAK